METGFTFTNGLAKTSIKVFGKSLYSGEQPLTAGTPGLPNLLLPPKAKWGVGNSRARETSEKRERRMMGTSVEREQGVMGRKRRERGKSLRFFSPSHHSLRPRFP